MAADMLMYHPFLSHLLKFFATTVGRDKLMRTVQYFARFYAWYLQRAHALPAASATTVAAWDATKKQLALARKFLRVGKALEHIRAAADTAAAATSTTANASSPASIPLVRYALVLRQLAYAAYLTLDSAALPHIAGIWRSPRGPRLVHEASRCWTVGLFASIVAQSYALYALRQRAARIDKKEGDGIVQFKRLNKERAACRTQLLMDLLDLTIPTSALGWVKLDDGVVGLAGLFSSLIGMQIQWQKTT